MNKLIVQIIAATPEYPKFVVMVRELKFDTIRQSEGYVTKQVREYRLRRDAEQFASRFGWQPLE